MTISTRQILPVLSIALAGLSSACATAQALATPTSTITSVVPTRTQVAAPTANTTLPTIAPSPTAEPTSTPTVVPTVTPTSTNTPTPTITSTPFPISLVGSCTEIWRPGSYKLANDVKTPIGRDCFYIQSHNVVFDCDNHTIEGYTRDIKNNEYAYYGISVRKFNFPLLETPTSVEIKNCKILHHRTGIYVQAANNISVHDNILSNNLNTVDPSGFGTFLGLTEGGGLRFDSVQGGRVENNTTENQAIGIDVRTSDNVVIRNNNSSRNSAWGVNLLRTTNSEVSGNTMRDNIRRCAWGSGTVGRGCDAGGIILQDGSSGNVVKENNVLGENGNGIFIKAHGVACGDNNLIQGNRIIDAVYNAVEFSFCTGNKIIGNEISGSYDGVFFGFTSNTEVRNNQISNMRNHGIISWNSRRSTISDNQIVNSREGVYFYWDEWDPKNYGFLPASPDRYASRDNVISNNVFRDNAVAAIRLQNSIQNRVLDNIFSYNAKNVWVQGNSEGNVINTP